MAIFTAIATAGLAAIGITSTFAVSVAAGALTLGASLGLSYLQKAVSGEAEQQQERFSVQGKLQAGGTVPRSFNLGYSVTAGSLVYANTWGIPNGTPNALLTQVIALSDLPGGELLDVFVNGEPVTLGADDGSGRGRVVIEYQKEGYDYLWIKYYDGTQTTADPLCVNVVGSADRPYPATRVGVGVAYVVVTALVEEKLFTGFPTFRFAVSGAKLYDPSKDSTVEGGAGSHRYSDPSTWGGDGDDLPVVQIYNLLRGINVNGQWLYGLQGMSAARLPTVNWIPQIEKCRALIDGESGQEPTYRSGGQINVNADLGSAIESLLSACQGRLSEIGGFYKIHVGAPGSPTFSWTDADLLSTEEQVYRPFFALADSINGVQATYPDPAQGWNMATAPPYPEDPDTTPEGGRRLMASPTLNFVPYRAQVQRLQKSVLLEAQRARTHVLPFPPAFWLVEPGDVGAWTSVRNGYIDKLFRVDGVVDQPNLDVSLYVTEVDPSDYDWDGGEFVESAIGPTVFPRPAPQGIVDWFAEGVIIEDETGLSRRPAIRLTWDGDMPGVVGVAFQVRNKWDQVIVHRGMIPEMGFAAGAVIISQNLLPNTEYQAQGQYIPSAPRDMLPSAWLDVTTPNVLLGMVELQAAIRYNISTLANKFNSELREIDAALSDALAEVAARTQLNKQILNQQSYDHRIEVIERIELGDAELGASIEEVRVVATSTEAAFASYQITVNARLGTAESNIVANATAFTNLNTAFASYQVAVNARFGTAEANITANATAVSNLSSAFSSYQVSVTAAFASTNANVTTTANALATLNSAFGSYTTTTNATLGSLTSTVTTQSTAIATLNGYTAAKYSVTLDVNGYATGFSLINGGGGISTFTVVADKFQIQLPGYNGNAPYAFFTTGTINGVPSVGITGNMYLDGTIFGTKIVAGSVTAVQIASQTITSDSGVIGALSLKSLSIGDNAVTVMQFDSQPGLVTGDYATNSSLLQVNAISVSIDTTGLAGKLLNVLVVWNALQFNSSGGAVAFRLLAAGNVVASVPNHVPFNGFSTVSLSGIYSFTGTGGVVTFTVQADWNGTAGNISQKVLSVVTGKR